MADVTTHPAIAAFQARRQRRSEHRWAYTGILKRPAAKHASGERGDRTPDGTAKADTKPPLVSSFLSDSSMTTNSSQATTAASSDTLTSTTALSTANSQVPAVGIPARTRPSSRRKIDEEAVSRMGRAAKKRIEALAQRGALLGKWRRRTRSSRACVSTTRHDECQVLDYQSERRDAYKIVARMNISSSLREIMGALSTDNSADFHLSMAATFGSLYVTGQNVNTIKTVGRPSSRGPSLANAFLRSRRSNMRQMSGRSSMSVSNIRIALNSVTLLVRHRLRRHLHDWNFLDYLDEKVDSMTVTRVLQSLNMNARRNGGSTQRRSFDNVMAGYLIREDPAAKFTSVFFYAEATPARHGSVQAHVSKPSIRLMRSMVETICELAERVERRRLSDLYRFYHAREAVPVAASRCFACNASFGLTRRRHSCVCCRHTVCHTCLVDCAVELVSVGVRGARVCRTCVSRVSLPAVAVRAHPLDDDEEADEDIVVVGSVGDAASDRG